MPPLAGAVGALALLTVLLIALIVLRPSLCAGRGGKGLAFVAFFLLPVTLTALGVSAHLEGSKQTEFCLSCHVMEPYGESLFIDDTEFVPANHYQNHRVPAETACYTCHTSYTMFGDMKAKLAGLKHVWVYYTGQTPEKIELYAPYQNRECLSCHGGARSFEESVLHMDIRAELASNEMSCLDCHSFVHAVEELDELPRWSPEESGP